MERLMRQSRLFAPLLVVMGLCACGDGTVRLGRKDRDRAAALKIVTQLECPDHQGPLTRVRTAANGLSCDYVGPRGAEVTLRLVRLADGQTAADVLPELDREVNALMPGLEKRVTEAAAEEARKSELARVETNSAEAEATRAEAAAGVMEARADALGEEAEAAAEAAENAAETGASSRMTKAPEPPLPPAPPVPKPSSLDETTHVRLPGVRIDADGAGAHIAIGPIRIDADDDKGKVRVHQGGQVVDIRAQEAGAIIRGRRPGPGLRANLVLVDGDENARGWRVVGYEARGPSSGPVVVAIARSRDRLDNGVYDAAKGLVKRNAGG